jgi:hypothetical protein
MCSSLHMQALNANSPADRRIEQSRCTCFPLLIANGRNHITGAITVGDDSAIKWNGTERMKRIRMKRIARHRNGGLYIIYSAAQARAS